MDARQTIAVVANFLVILGLVIYAFTLFAEYESRGRWAKNMTGLLAGIGMMVLAIALLLGVMTQFAAGLASVYLLIAAAANYKVSRKWLWHIGGSEWSVFWAICCAIVAWFGTAV